MSIYSSENAPDGIYSVVFEDNGKVAYGYLLRDGRIVGDVWLYNRLPAPKERPWSDRSLRPPFLNPEEFVDAEDFTPVSTGDEVTFIWSEAEGSPVVDILIHSAPHARIKLGAKPGWCRLASKDGPLARRMA
jgi:hypothetical protein